MAQAVRHHVNKRGGGQAFIGQGVHKLAEIGDQMVFAGDVAIKKIRKRGHRKDYAGHQMENSVVIGGANVGTGRKEHEKRHKDHAQHRKLVGQVHSPSSLSM